jgi:hypothetical protein
MSITIVTTTLVGFEVSEKDFYSTISSPEISCPKECPPQGAGKFCAECGAQRVAKISYEITEGFERLLATVGRPNIFDLRYSWREYCVEGCTKEQSPLFGSVVSSLPEWETPKTKSVSRAQLDEHWEKALQFRTLLLGESTDREIKLYTHLYVS